MRRRVTSILLLVACYFTALNAQFALKLHDGYKPPSSIPTDPDQLLYNIAALDQGREPVVVQLVDSNGDRVMDNITVTVTTVPASGADTYTGVMCAGTRIFSEKSFRYWNGSTNDQWRCYTSGTYPRGYIQNSSSDGEVYYVRMLHTEGTVANRKYQFTADYNGQSLTLLSDEYRVFHQQTLPLMGILFPSTNGLSPYKLFHTNVTIRFTIVNVHNPAAKVMIVNNTAGNSVPVNTPFDFTLATMFEYPLGSGNFSQLTEGPHSRLHIDCYVHYKFKLLYKGRDKGGNYHKILESDVTLGGNGVRENAKFDLMIRKRASSGLVVFDGIRILDVMDDVQLNFTQTLPFYPWERRPFSYTEQWFAGPISKSKLLNTTDAEDSPAVAVSHNFNVTASIIAELRMDTTAMDSTINSNFKFVNPPSFSAHDSSGYLLTSGPDSSLVLTIAINPPTACLSVDSTTVTLHRGVGAFSGSICRPDTNLMLTFSTVSTNGTTFTTPPTPSFDSSGTLRFSLSVSSWRNGLQWAICEAARTMLNDGYWAPVFAEQGRNIDYAITYREKYETDNSSWAFMYYRTIDKANKDPEGEHIHAIFGGQYDHDSLALSSFAFVDKIPVAGVYMADSDDLSNKVYHPYFYRVNRAYKLQFEGMVRFLKAHLWTKIIVLSDTGTPVASGFFTTLLEFGIEYYEVKIDGASSLTGALELDDVKIAKAVETIKSLNIRFIMLMMATPTCHRMYIEAMNNGFAPYHGYQWVALADASDYFGWRNQYPGCLDGPLTCTVAFKGLLFIMQALVHEAYNFERDVYAPIYRDGFYDLYTKQDPYEIRGYFISYSARTHGRYGSYVDAMIAQQLVACWFFERNMTFDPDMLISILQNVSFDGLSGMISFDENGNRIGYDGYLIIVDPQPDGIVLTFWDTFRYGYISFTEDGELIDRQLFYRMTIGRDNGIYHRVSAGVRVFANSSYNNIIRLNGTIMYEPFFETETPHNYVLTVPAVFHCTGGCGGGKTNPDLIWYYNYGECVAMETCQCKFKEGKNEVGYAGKNCEQILCNPQCKHGECISPDNCICDDKYTGMDCGTPICSHICVADQGTCTAPDYCHCEEGYWGSDCSGMCDCGEHGECNSGSTGNGMCTCDSLYIGNRCEQNLVLVVVPTLLAAIVVVSAVITLITLLLVYVIRREKYKAALANNDWKIEYSHVHFTDADDGKSFRSLMSMQSQIKRNKHVIRNEGKYRDQPVVIKRLKKDSIIDTLTLRKEIKEMRDLKHTNVTNFIGACLDSPNVAILIELAGKGSLDDLLSSSEVKIDWNFKYSMLKDICRGMIYLSKSPIKSHGRLKSSNCVVDNRWCVKITDFGLHLFKSGQQGVPKKPFKSIKEAIDEEAIHSRGPQGSGDRAQISGFSQNSQVMYTTIKFDDRSIAQSLLWIPPEFLKCGVLHPNHVENGTTAGDIYSLGLIMSEMVNHEGPFSDFLDYMLPTEILDTICGYKNHAIHTLPPNLAEKYKGVNPPPFRPSLKDDCDYDLKSLMSRCWADDSRKRPTLPDVLNSLEEINPQKGELIDNLVYMLEKYSTNLEKVVAARTGQLAVEKQKTEDLLSRMLPKSVSEALKEGRTVEAETFDCVTIYFSDIVGFTAIAGGSTPMQVVSFLNDLYSAFDHALYNYDVYKVETIGDAYMVVSGLPIRNGDNHAGEICQMAIHLLSDISRFTIRHKPDVVLQLRIGVHSGPVVAGVVGLKMPRYCLFGDTVNVSSRMESSGLALRVHVSEDTAVILKKLGGYQLECRGTREVKGKGRMTTYWLRGKEGFHKKIPDASLAVSESQHEFK